MSQTLQRWLGTMLLAAMALSAMYSANTFKLRDRFPPPATRLESSIPAGPAVEQPGKAGGEASGDLRQQLERSHPWWQEIASHSGSGPRMIDPFPIAPRAIQWRIAWKCEAGTFSAAARLPSGQTPARALVPATACPKEGTGYSVKVGRIGVTVNASGPWTLKIEQQVDVPLVEPPLAEMSGPQAKVVRSGTFYGVDRVGRGTIKIVELPNGKMAIRLEGFFVSQNSDLELRLSVLPEPKSTPEIAAAPVRNLEFLKATTGAMNYLLPEDVEISRYRSMVIWCELTHNAYAAASLR